MTLLRTTRGVVRFAAASVLATLLAAACFAERRGLSRDALLKTLDEARPTAALPTIEALWALRVPNPPPAPTIDVARLPTQDARAHAAAALGDTAAAERAWSAGGVEMSAHRCLVEGVLRRYDAVLASCTAFLDAAPFDARAPAAVRVLLKAKPGTRAAADRIADRGAAWVAACAAKRPATGCADLAWLVSEEREEHARTHKDANDLADAIDASGRLREVWVDGPFDGDLRTLFARDLRGEAPHARALFARSTHFTDEDGVLEPALRNVDGLYRLRFAATGAGVAHLFVTGSHALRVRVDGVVVAERPADVPSPGIGRAAIELKKGVHVIDVLAWSTGRGDRIIVAALGDDGRPALTPLAGPTPEVGSGAALAPASSAVEALKVELGDVGGADGAGTDDIELLTRLLWRQTLARQPSFGIDPDESRQLTTVLIGRFGWSPLALAVAAESLGEDHSVPDRLGASSAARLWARVREVWPDHPVARIAEARNKKEERPDEALAAYRELVKIQPRYPFGQRELIELALDHGLLDEARDSARALLAVEPSPENIDAALPALRAAGDAHTAAVMDAQRASLDDNVSSTRAARHALDAGATSEGLAALAAAASSERGSAAVEELAGLRALRAPKDALADVAHALADFPNDPSLNLKKAELTLALDGEVAARSVLLGALPRIRDSDRATKLSEELGVDPPWVAHLVAGDAVLAQRRAMPTLPFPGYPAVALLDDVERILYDDESSLVVRHLIVELRSKEVLDRFGEMSLGDVRVVRLRVIKPDGSIVERERRHGVDDLSLPQLTERDTVELLTVDRDPPVRLGGSFETRGLDGAATPALSRRYIVSFPEGWDDARGLTLLAQNGLALPPREAFVDNEGRRRTRVVFALQNVDAVPGEPFSPDSSETARTGGFAWGVDLGLWARLRGVNVEQAALRTHWLDESARAVAGSGDDRDKLQRIFNFVVRRIEPENAPDDATAVLATGQGARTPLFLALLRGAGLDAAPVGLQLATQPDPSTMDGGSYGLVAVRVRLADGDHFAIVDGNAVLDALPAAARGAQVLELALPGAHAAPHVTPLPDTALEEGGVRVQVDVGLDADGAGLSGLIVVTIPSAKADGARRGVRRATPDQLRVVVERAFAESFPGISVSEVKTPDLALAGEPLRIGAQVKIPLPETADGAARFDHLFAQGASGGLQLEVPLSAYLAVADRKMPLLVTGDRELLEVQLSLPATAAFVEAPEQLSTTVGPFTLEQKVEITNGRLYWRREIRKENGRVAADAWPAVRTGLAGLAARADAHLSFVTAPGKGQGRTSSDTGGQNRAPVDQNR